MTTRLNKIRPQDGLLPVDEPTIFTDELATSASIKMLSDEEFFAHAAKRVREISAGHPMQATTNISFNSVQAFLNVMTPKRYELLKAVQEKGHFDSVDLLAAELGRDTEAVSEDVKALRDAGLIIVRDILLVGHGQRAEIMPIAKTLNVEFSM